MSIEITITVQSARKTQMEQRQEVDLPAAIQVAVQHPDRPLQIIVIGIDDHGNTVKRVDVQPAPTTPGVPKFEEKGKPSDQDP